MVRLLLETGRGRGGHWPEWPSRRLVPSQLGRGSDTLCLQVAIISPTFRQHPEAPEAESPGGLPNYSTPGLPWPHTVHWLGNKGPPGWLGAGSTVIMLDVLPLDRSGFLENLCSKALGM